MKSYIFIHMLFKSQGLNLQYSIKVTKAIKYWPFSGAYYLSFDFKVFIMLCVASLICAMMGNTLCSTSVLI